MKERLLHILLGLTVTLSLFAQSGNGTYEYLDGAPSSHVAAIGGANVAIQYDELTDAFCNPALLDSATHKTLSFNYGNYMRNTMMGTVAYGHNYKKNYFGAGIQYVDYGKFQGADEYGTKTGTFRAKDIAFNLMYARKLNDFFTAGVTIKPLYATYERYNSFGLACDIGVHFHTRDNAFQAGLVFRNAGVQLKGFYDDELGKTHREKLPFDIQMGIAGKFKHAPLRMFLTLHDLHKWNLSYEYTNTTTTDESNGNVTYKNNTIKSIDMLFRHTIVGVEIVPNKPFSITLAYNHQRNREMREEGFKGLGGFSAGAHFCIYHLHFGFAMAPYQKGNMAYFLSLTTHIDDFKK